MKVMRKDKERNFKRMANLKEPTLLGKTMMLFLKLIIQWR